MKKVDIPHILVIDDEPIILSAVAEIAQIMHPHVLKASDGRQALEYFDHYRIACVISDINMPHMTGLELLKEIRKRGHDTPIVLVTAVSDKKMLLEAIRLGAADYIEKPFDVESLMRLIERSYELGLAILELEDELDAFVQHSLLSPNKLQQLKECKKAIRLMSLENDSHGKKRKIP